MLVRMYEENPDQRQIIRAAEILRKGGIVILPTDTVYAFCASIENKNATELISKANHKHLDPTTFSILCHDLSHLSDFCAQIPNWLFRIMKSVLPGPYTFILNANGRVPKLIHSKKKTVGIRVPDNKITREIIRELGTPLLSSSLKDDDDVIEYTTDPELIYEKYGDDIELIIDGGYGDNNPSTVLNCTGEEIEIIRLGKGPVDFISEEA